MRALLFPHVDQFRGFLNPAEGTFHHRLRVADKGYDGAIGARAGIDVEQRNSIDRFNRGGDLPDEFRSRPSEKLGTHSMSFCMEFMPSQSRSRCS